MSPTPDQDEPALVRRVASRDQAALAALHDRYARPMYALAMKITGVPEEAEEIVTDVFCQAWRTADRYDPARARVDAWLFMMTRSRALDRVRAAQRDLRKREAQASEAAARPPERVSDPEAEAELAERRRAVHAALAGLTGPQREALELAFYEGLTHTEVAERVGEPLGTIKTRIRAGLGKLREALAPAWGVTTP
jgi:RNA polymerase sigma-70 factor (ECF subfamily)